MPIDKNGTRARARDAATSFAVQIVAQHPVGMLCTAALGGLWFCADMTGINGRRHAIAHGRWMNQKFLDVHAGLMGGAGETPPVCRSLRVRARVCVLLNFDLPLFREAAPSCLPVAGIH